MASRTDGPGPSLAALRPVLVLWLNKRTKVTASPVILRPGLAVGMVAARVVPFPGDALSRGGVCRCLNFSQLET